MNKIISEKKFKNLKVVPKNTRLSKIKTLYLKYNQLPDRIHLDL